MLGQQDDWTKDSMAAFGATDHRKYNYIEIYKNDQSMHFVNHLSHWCSTAESSSALTLLYLGYCQTGSI